jgi:hypothetical protein
VLLESLEVVFKAGVWLVVGFCVAAGVVDPTVGVVPLVAAAVGESVGVEVACCPAVSVVRVIEICGAEPCAVAGVAVKNNAARDSSIAATIGILPFEPADAKRSTKCVAGSHSKVLLVNLAPCFMTQFLSYVLYWRQTRKGHHRGRLIYSPIAQV